VKAILPLDGGVGDGLGVAVTVGDGVGVGEEVRIATAVAAIVLDPFVLSSLVHATVTRRIMLRQTAVARVTIHLP
jgi:hypothetical protein